MLPLLAALFVVALSGCATEEKVKALEGKEGERIYLDGLVYQVQLSRILNPRDVEDEAYTRGLPAPRPSESYYGVFIRVDNEKSEKPLLPVAAERMRILDAAGREFEPIPVPESPGITYEPSLLAKGEFIPIPDTAAFNYPTRGGLVLFKLPYTSLDNRPLILEIEGRGGKIGEVDLDV